LVFVGEEGNFNNSKKRRTIGVLLIISQTRTDEIDAFIQAGIDDKSERLAEVAKSLS
jgi:hypothetical protein